MVTPYKFTVYIILGVLSQNYTMIRRFDASFDIDSDGPEANLTLALGKSGPPDYVCMPHYPQSPTHSPDNTGRKLCA